MSNEVKVEETVVKRGRPRKYPYPAILTCSVSGRQVKTNPTQFQVQLNKSGLTQEEFIRSYVCRSARVKAKQFEKVEKAEKVETVETPTTPVVN